MKILIFGDVYGRIGRKAFKKEFEALKKQYQPDFVLVNVDNISSGRGVILKHIQELKDLGVDILTGGDHIFDNFSDISGYLEQENSFLLRFANLYDETVPGKGYKIFEKEGKKVLCIHLQGEIFMNHKVDNPFIVAEKIINKHYDEVDGIIIDFHKETTSEGYGLAYYLEGKASAIFGTHTHVQTNDEIILENGTAFISDVGMNGPLYSIIGASFASVKQRFVGGIQKGKIEQELTKNYVVSGLFIEIGTDKKALQVEKIRKIGKL